MEVKILQRPGFSVAGMKTWISGPDNEQFGRFWKECHNQGVINRLNHIRHPERQHVDANGSYALPAGALLGISRIENDPTNRAFYYMIAVEVAANSNQTTSSNPENDSDTSFQEGAQFECYDIPAGLWAVFPCHGTVPESIMNSEIYCFTEWLPNSPYVHAGTVEMELYPDSSDETYCEFWLQIKPR